MRLKIALIFILTIMCICVFGCSQEADNSITNEETVDIDKHEGIMDEETVDIEKHEDISEEDITELSWTDSPTLEVIPNAPVKGEANGVEFIAETIFFEPRGDKWRLIITDQVFSTPTDILSGGQNIYIDMPEVPETGSIFIKDMKYGNGFFQIRKKDNPNETTSWNANNAYAIEITSWEVSKYDPNEKMFQVAGKASGKVFIAYSGEGWDNFDNSWAAGTFTDIPVRYMGAPKM